MSDEVRVNVDKSLLEKLIKESPEKADRAIEAVAREGERIVKTSFGTSPPGRTYKRGGKIHVASISPYPPNVDIGTLSNSINVYRPGMYQRIIRAGTEYAAMLEFGTRNMGPRPFMSPMAAKLRRQAGEIVAGFLKS